MATKVNENTELAIPLKSLLGLIAGTAVAVWDGRTLVLLKE